MTTHSLKEIAVRFLSLAASGNVAEAYDQYVGENFRHHNPHFKGDATSLKEAMQENAINNPNKILEVQRTLQEGDQVAVLSRVRQNPNDRGGAVVHIFRFEAGKIVELWDVGQAIPENLINENGMF